MQVLDNASDEVSISTTNHIEKYLHTTNIDISIFVSLKKDSRTRGHEITLVKDQCRLDIRKYSFSQRTINQRS